MLLCMLGFVVLVYEEPRSAVVAYATQMNQSLLLWIILSVKFIEVGCFDVLYIVSLSLRSCTCNSLGTSRYFVISIYTVYILVLSLLLNYLCFMNVQVGLRHLFCLK